MLTIDEFEAVRLADLGDLYQEKAAARMGISRQTFGRIIGSAHYKIADVLIHGKALKIEGGEVSINKMKPLRCRKCLRAFEADGKADGDQICPDCGRQKSNKYDHKKESIA